MITFRILYQDQDYVVIEKPAGFQVHPPEDRTRTLSNSRNILYLLGKQLGLYLYPVHRLDRGTSGVLAFALNPLAAKTFQSALQTGEFRKVYYCVVRGWTKPSFQIDHPLATENAGAKPLEATTRFESVGQLEIPLPNKRYSTSRFSLLKALPVQGRLHQIRRHLKHAAHPIIGDSVYGDTEQNRIFEQFTKEKGLKLHAYSLEGLNYYWRTRWPSSWHQVFDHFGVCAFSAQTNPRLKSIAHSWVRNPSLET